MLNWLARYAPLRDMLLDGTGGPRSSVLDVGCGPHGLACAFPDVPFVGTDVLFPHRVAPNMVAVRSRPGPLPFADGAFGTVLCLDVLEHVPGPERLPFVAELARVAADRVILGCPTDEIQPVDDFLCGVLGEPMPLWLAEHYECGLPSPGEVTACANAQPGFTARQLPTANGLLAVLTAVGDSLPVFATPASDEYRRHREQWIDLFASATFGDSPRKVWAIERDAPLQPLVDPGCKPEDVASALRCPDCGGAHCDLVCVDCGRPVQQDATNAWDLSTSFAPRGEAAPAPLDTEAATILWLSPDWDSPATWLPALEAYIDLADAEDDCCLVLEIAGTADVADTVARACAELAGDGAFGDVLLATAPVQRPERAQSVDGSAAVVAALANTAA